VRVPRAAEMMRQDMSSADDASENAKVGRRGRRARKGNPGQDEDGGQKDRHEGLADPVSRSLAPGKLEVGSELKSEQVAAADAPSEERMGGAESSNVKHPSVGTSDSTSPTGPERGNPSPKQLEEESDAVGQAPVAAEISEATVQAPTTQRGAGMGAEEDVESGQPSAQRSRRALVVGGQEGELWGGEQVSHELQSPGSSPRRFKCPGSRSRGRAPSVMFRRVFLGLIVAVIVVVVTRLSIADPSKVPSLDR
jgi:hypothetical protein